MKLLKRVINVFSKLFDTLHEANVLINHRFLNHLKLESFARWRQALMTTQKLTFLRTCEGKSSKVSGSTFTLSKL